MAGMLIWNIAALIKLNRKLQEAVPLSHRVYVSDQIDTAFVLGFGTGRIYLPVNLTENQQVHILRHEQYHLKRGDHRIKLLAFLALCIHWFNPLVWLAFVLAMRDMELSCDEAAITALSEDFTECTQLLCGNTENGEPAIFIDGVVGPSAIRTEILRLSENRLTRTPQNNPLFDSVRPSGYAAQDIDGDGIVEIPGCNVFPGYEDLSETEQITMTSWYTFSDNRLIKKHTGYYSINEGFFFLLPDRWKNKVTLKRDNVAEELVFCAYSGSLQGSTNELLRLCITADPVTVADCLDNGYLLLGAKGGTQYLAKSADSDDPLLLTTGEIITAFLY